jgi:hypothetical protein
VKVSGEEIVSRVVLLILGIPILYYDYQIVWILGC